MIFSWASCSTDVILRQVLLGSKAQISKSIRIMPCLPADLPAILCSPPPLSAFWCIPAAKAEAWSVHLRFLCFLLTLDNRGRRGAIPV